MDSNHPSVARARRSLSIFVASKGSPWRDFNWAATAAGAMCRNPVKRSSSRMGASLPLIGSRGVSAVRPWIRGKTGVADSKSAPRQTAVLKQVTRISPCTEEDERTDDGQLRGVVRFEKTRRGENSKNGRAMDRSAFTETIQGI